MIASLSGINQVAFTKLPGNDITRVSVESRPTAMTVDPKRQCAFVANTLSDSISIIDIPSRSVTGTVKLGPIPEPTLTDQGERLFYNAKLSLDGWYSCNSCHINGHSNGLRNDNFNPPSLRGVSQRPNFFHDNRASSLREVFTRYRHPDGDLIPQKDLEALLAYLKQL